MRVNDIVNDRTTYFVGDGIELLVNRDVYINRNYKDWSIVSASCKHAVSSKDELSSKWECVDIHNELIEFQLVIKNDRAVIVEEDNVYFLDAEDFEAGLTGDQVNEFPYRLVLERFYRLKRDRDQLVIVAYEEFSKDASRHVFVGDYQNIREIEVEKFIRYRDGGTTEIYTEKGMIYWPSSFNKSQESNFENDDLLRIDDVDDLFMKKDFYTLEKLNINRNRLC